MVLLFRHRYRKLDLHVDPFRFVSVVGCSHCNGGKAGAGDGEFDL